MTKEEDRDELRKELCKFITLGSCAFVYDLHENEELADFILQREKSLRDKVAELEKKNEELSTDELAWLDQISILQDTAYALEQKIADMVKVLKAYKNTYNQADWETMSGCGEFLAIDNAIRILEK